MFRLLNAQSPSHVYCMHGVVHKKNEGLFIHRNMNDADAFVEHLRSRPAPYVSLQDARAGKGDALTIDDATYAACAAIRMAYEEGHHITWFVNPWNIQNRTPYAPALLNTLLDSITSDVLIWRGERYFVRTCDEKKIVRSRIRHSIQHLTPPDDADAVEICAQQNGVILALPEHLNTVSKDEFLNVATRGSNLSISNHGWQHIHHEKLTSDKKRANIEKGRTWLHEVLRTDSPEFAVPFGVDSNPCSSAGETWYLLDEEKKPGVVDASLFNRIVLSTH